MPDQANAARPPEDQVRQPRLNAQHPLAAVAARLCTSHLGAHRRFGLGGVACGSCWEEAIRADERVVIELGLPPRLVRDPALVDDVAVERACAGDPVRLTKAERRAAVGRLLASGLTSTQAAGRLGMSGSRISEFLPAGEVAA